MVAGEIRLNFNLSDISIGKNSGALQPMTVPHPEAQPNFLGDVIRQMKQNINSRSAVSINGNQLKDLREHLHAMSDANSFQAEMQRMQQMQATTSERRMLVSIAKEKGFVLDRAQGVFVADPNNPQASQATAPVPAAAAATATAEPAATPAAAEPQTAATQSNGNAPTEPDLATPSNGANPATEDAGASQVGQTAAEAENEFAPPPAMVEEPPPPVNDPFSNPESSEQDFDF